MKKKIDANHHCDRQKMHKQYGKYKTLYGDTCRIEFYKCDCQKMFMRITDRINGKFYISWKEDE